MSTMNTSEVQLPIILNNQEKSHLLFEPIDTYTKIQPQDDTALTAPTNANATTTTDIRPKFRSQCPTSTDLPDIVRDMTWYDPFYNNEEDVLHVVAVFDFDCSKYDQSVWFDTLIFMCCNFIAYAIVSSVYIAMLIFLWWWLFFGRNRKNRRVEFHVAMTVNSIYVDKSPALGSNDVVPRKVIPFHDILSCAVKWERLTCTGPATPKIVMIINDTDCPLYFIRFIPNAQEFVDIVNVMKERSSNNVSDDDNINTTTIVPLGDVSLLAEIQQQQQQQSSEMDYTRNHPVHQEDDILVPVATIAPFDSINVNVTEDTTAREIV